MKAFLLLLMCVPSLVLAETKELYWEDMMPPDYIQPDIHISHDGSMMQLNLDAPVVTALNGQKVKIPGFVVPLEGDDKLTTEFLLVPFFGACIHVPPPPPNQIVYVKFSKGVPIDNLYDAVWVTGILSTEGWSGDIATVGYSLTGISVEPFEG
jgi:hypothetical protein